VLAAFIVYLPAATELGVMWQREFSNMSPILSGMIGAIIAGLISAAWLKRYPCELSKQAQKSLLKKYTSSINFCNAVFLAIMVAGIYLFKTEAIPNHWSWGLLLIGGALASPLVTLIVPIAGHSHKFSEAHAALAIKSYLPIRLQFFCLMLGLVMFIAGCVGLVVS